MPEEGWLDRKRKEIYLQQGTQQTPPIIVEKPDSVKISIKNKIIKPKRKKGKK